MTARTMLPAALSAALFLPVAAAKPETTVLFEPDTDFGEELSLQGSTWVAEGEPFKAWIKEIDGEERLNFIERMGGVAIDPFAGRPDKPPAYHTLLVVIENTGAEALDFNPQSCWLKTNRNKVLLPLGMSDLSFNYRVTGQELPVAYQNVHKAIFERAVSVAPGERLAGMLVYQRVPPATKRWNLNLRLIHSAGEKASVNVPYRRVGLKDKKKKAGGSGP